MGKRKHMKKEMKKENHAASHEHKHRERHPKKQGPSVGSIVFLSIFGIIIIYSAFVALGSGGATSVDPNFNYEALASCILESEAIFYGTEWCSFCNQQKELLGPIFSELGNEFFVDCDINSSECRTAGVTSYPSWYINGRLISGVQSLDALASATGCTL